MIYSSSDRYLLNFCAVLRAFCLRFIAFYLFLFLYFPLCSVEDTILLLVTPYATRPVITVSRYDVSPYYNL